MAPGILLDEGTESIQPKRQCLDYAVTDKPLGTRRPLRIITIGAGASGLNLARHIDLHMDEVEHIIYEKNEDVGGTWFENR